MASILGWFLDLSTVPSSCILFLSSTKVIFLLDLDLSGSKGLTVLQNFLLSTLSLWFELA